MATDTEQLILSISADISSVKRTLKRLEGDAEDTGNKIKKSFEIGGSRSMRALQNDAKNLIFQLNDIATGLSTGQSPFMIMNQQMGQVTQILGGRGLTGALEILKMTLASSWPMLALVGISALAGAAVEYFTTSEKESKEATKELEAHAKAIQELAEEYGALFPELQRVADRQEAAADAAKKAEAVQTTLAGAYEDTKKAVDGMAPASRKCLPVAIARHVSPKTSMRSAKLLKA